MSLYQCSAFTLPKIMSDTCEPCTLALTMQSHVQPNGFCKHVETYLWHFIVISCTMDRLRSHFIIFHLP